MNQGDLNKPHKENILPADIKYRTYTKWGRDG